MCRAALLLAVVLPAARAPAADLAASDIYRQTLRGTAWVITPAKGKGSSWLLDGGRRLLVTNHHVVAGHDTVDVVFPTCRDGRLITDRTFYLHNMKELRRSGRAVGGRVLRTDSDRDLALVELDAVPDGVEALRLAGERPGPGEEVYSVGNRGDLDVLWTHTAGWVRQIGRTEEGYFWHGRRLAKGAGVLLVQSPVNEGDSGGPLVNGRGEVVGVVSAVRWQARLASLGIDADEVRAFVAGRPTTPSPPGKGTDLYRRVLRSVAMVKTSSSNGRATAWVLDRERKLLVTAAAAAGAHDYIDVFLPHSKDGKLTVEPAYYRDNRAALRAAGHLQRGRVLARDASRNLALVEVDSLPEGTAALPLTEGNAEPGDRLHALGNPNSIEALWVYAAGSVRQRGNMKLEREAGEVAVLVTQLPLSDGDSGGPLVDDHGQLVGVITGRDAPQQLVSYALDVAEVRAFVAATKPMWAPQTADDFRRRAAYYARIRQWDRAVAEYDRLLRLEPKDAAALSERGHAVLMAGDPGRAIADCNAALRLDGKLVSAYVHRAAAYSRKGDQDRAIADGTEALRLDPKSASAFAARGNAHRLKGDLARALADCDEAIFRDPNSAPAHHCRGLIHGQRGEHDKAVADLARAANLDPNWAAAWQALADALRKKGDQTRAAEADERAREAEPR